MLNRSKSLRGDDRMSTDDRQEILELYKDLRVADVRDGMDWNMMHHYGSLDADFRPLFRTRVVGIAKTARYVPYEGPVPHMSPEEYTKWVSWYYQNVCTEPWQAEIQQGDLVCLDQSGFRVGIIGSNNSLNAYKNGCVGFLSNGGPRDTDEIVLQKIPFWSRFISQGMDQGRIRYESHNQPVVLGGVTINTGDVVVADGDGVIVVPRAKAREVAKYAQQELEGDKVGRRKLYDALGWEHDDTVK